MTVRKRPSAIIARVGLLFPRFGHPVIRDPAGFAAARYHVGRGIGPLQGLANWINRYNKEASWTDEVPDPLVSW